MVILLYIICSQIPIFGAFRPDNADPLYWLRMIMASNRGTLMELGIGPLVTASMIMQLLSGTKIISIDQNDKDERKKFKCVEKCKHIYLHR